MHTLIDGTNMPAVKRRKHQQANCRAGRQAFHRNIARPYRDAHPSPANTEPGTFDAVNKIKEADLCLTLRVALYTASHTAPRSDISISKQKGRRPHVSPVKPIHFQSERCRVYGHFVLRQICRRLNGPRRRYTAVWIFPIRLHSTAQIKCTELHITYIYRVSGNSPKSGVQVDF